MKKTLLVLALSSLFNVAYAQNTPATSVVLQPNAGTAPVAPVTTPGNLIVPLSAPTLKAGSENINPFTGVSKENEIDAKTLNTLKQQKEVSSQKLQLKRDELENLRIDLEKRKLGEALNPIVPEPVKPVVQKKPKPLPVVIYPSASKNETPVLVGVITAGGQQVAMFEHDGKAIRATVGSTVGGKVLADISANSVKLGDTYLGIPGKKGYPTIALNDKEGPLERGAKKVSGPVSIPTSATPATSNASFSTVPGTNIPSSPQKANAFGMLPPPPPTAKY